MNELKKDDFEVRAETAFPPSCYFDDTQSYSLTPSDTAATELFDRMITDSDRLQKALDLHGIDADEYRKNNLDVSVEMEIQGEGDPQLYVQVFKGDSIIHADYVKTTESERDTLAEIADEYDKQHGGKDISE